MLTETDFMKLVNEKEKKRAFLKETNLKKLILLYLLMGLIEVATEFLTDSYFSI
jgi:hypothetical protein